MFDVIMAKPCSESFTFDGKTEAVLNILLDVSINELIKTNRTELKKVLEKVIPTLLNVDKISDIQKAGYDSNDILNALKLLSSLHKSIILYPTAFLTWDYGH